MNKTKIIELIRKRSNIVAFIMCALGILLNMLLSTAVSSLGIPLYLDTVGTVAVAVMGGYLPGAVVGFATNILKSISDPSSLYYGVLNVLIALSASFLAERGCHKKIRGMILMVIVFILIGGGLGTIIPWFMEGLSFDSESLSGVIYGTGFVNQGVSHLLASIIMDIPDKMITVMMALIIVRFIPEKFYHYFSFNSWMQKPIDEEEAAVIGRSSVRVMSLRRKILLVLSASLATVALVATITSYVIYRKTVIKDHIRIAQGTAKIAAGALNGDHIDAYLRNGGDSEEYRQTEEILKGIRNSSADIAYLYVYKIDADGCHVVFDVDTEEFEGEEIGTLIPFDEEFTDYIPDLLLGNEIDTIITNDQYGYLLTAYQPVYDSYGKCVCYVGADVDMGQLSVMERSFITEMVSVFLGFFLLLCIFTVWLTYYHLVIPINSIVGILNRLAHSSDTQEAMDEDVKMFRKLNIHTGDELENLFVAIEKMTKNQSEQMRSIRRLSDSTAKMQDGLIITMADLVESRDSDTGAHVQKTAAYVKIIVEGLKKKGYYLQKLTPKFMSDVVRSAPLHDIGKINIPDEVLNKPGKLTDKEFEIMKTHTTAGKRIIENAISTVKGDNYLKEARNMAAYHHERWDGKGYPEGIHGEVIPLSARIMAVADVFDALTSPRIYKPAFPLDKALNILEEGKGTQFDPKCVEVFFDALPEVKVILRKYNKDTV